MKKTILWVTSIIFISKILFAMANISQGVLLSDFIATFSLKSSGQGITSAAASAGTIIAMLLSVPIASRIGKLRLFSGALLLIMLMLFCAGAAPTALLLTAAYCLMGFGFGSLDTTASAIVADLHQGPRAPLMMGLLHAAYGSGGILAPIILTAALTRGTSWRTVLFALGTVVLAAGIVCLIIFSRAKEKLPLQAQPTNKLTRAGLLAFARHPGNLALVLCGVGYCAHQASISVWIVRVIGEGFGNAELGAVALTLFWIGTVLSRLIVPLLGISTVRYIRWSLLLAAALLLFSGVIAIPIVLCVASAIAGLLGGATLPMLLSEISARNPDQSMLSITAILLTTGVATMFCSPLIGFIIGKTALIAVPFISAAFAMLCAGSAFLMRRAPRHTA